MRETMSVPSSSVCWASCHGPPFSTLQLKQWKSCEQSHVASRSHCPRLENSGLVVFPDSAALPLMRLEVLFWLSVEGIVPYRGGALVMGVAGCHGSLLVSWWTRKQRGDRKWDLTVNLQTHPEPQRYTSYNQAPHAEGSMTS